MLIFPLLNDLSRKIIHIDMDAFLLRSKSEIILNSEENLSLSVATLDKQGGRGVVSTLVAMRRELWCPFSHEFQRSL